MSDLDTLDRQIIVELRHDGRLANTEIARRLGTSEATIRSRVQRLVAEGIIRVAAAVNLTSLGYDVHVIIGIHCDANQIQDVMRKLSDVPEVRMVAAVSGQWDLLVTASFQSKEDLFGFLTGRLANMAGVRKTETIHMLREVKRDSYYWEAEPLPENSSAGDGNGRKHDLAQASLLSSISGEEPNGEERAAGSRPRVRRRRVRRPVS